FLLKLLFADHISSVSFCHLSSLPQLSAAEQCSFRSSQDVCIRLQYLQQLGDRFAGHARHFFPVAINLRNRMEATTAAQATTGTTVVNNGQSLFTIEAYGGHDFFFSSRRRHTRLGTGSLNSSGQVTFSTSTFAAGPHSITASYNGNTNFA